MFWNISSASTHTLASRKYHLIHVTNFLYFQQYLEKIRVKSQAQQKVGVCVLQFNISSHKIIPLQHILFLIKHKIRNLIQTKVRAFRYEILIQRFQFYFSSILITSIQHIYFKYMKCLHVKCHIIRNVTSNKVCNWQFNDSLYNVLPY